VPGPASAASCYLLEAEGPDGDGTVRTWRVLLDLGSGALGPLQGYIDPMTVDAVLLSHLHADHCLDLCGLYVMLKHAPAAVPGRSVPVWGPTDTAGRLARAYDLPAEPGMGGQLDVRAWADRQPVRIGPLLVEPVRVEHPVEAYGLRVTGPSESGGTAVLAYTGDTDDCPALDDLARDADLLLCEATLLERHPVERGIHLTGARAGELAARSGARRTVLTHVPPWTDPAEVLAEAASRCERPLALAVPGEVLVL
jgi:ribonuclease BN (tRNA processing enzyme)